MTEQADLSADPRDAGGAAAQSATRVGRTPRAHRVAHAAETRRLYAADWAAFAKWCGEHRQVALPAASATLAAYLGSLATTLQHGALARRAAAVADQHRRMGHPSPGADETVRDVLRAARRARRSADAALSASPDALTPRPPVRHRRPPSREKLARMAARCPGDLAGLRDRALLLLTAAGIGGERLLALDCEHVRLTGHGAELAVRGIGGEAAAVVILGRLRGSATCPVRALEAWLHSSETRFGPVFRKVNRWGGVENDRLRADALRRIVRRRAKAVQISRRPEADPA